MNRLLWCGLVAGGLLAVSSVRAEEEKAARPSKEEIIKKFDKDGDGKLSEEERKAVGEAFKSRGRPGGPEAGNRPNKDEIIKKFDKDGDGKLNEEERKAAMEAMKAAGLVPVRVARRTRKKSSRSSTKTATAS